ncbi:biotin-dependent carboxyltransferase family protein [Agrobacterium sp. NPDC089420]|uniref:5-oxoprolinase subunit C family protein n=1 Tax=Agrobacterium sp. NPDC089420 TaxID=3363918 RepID=UPI0038513CB1
MSFLVVEQIGPMATVQDLGRKGLHHAGVSSSGPMDIPSFRIANALVGNGENSAAIEFAGTGGSFSVVKPVRIAVTGGGVDIRLGKQRLLPWESYVLLPGDVLAIGALRDCVWGYLAISGGVDVVPVLGSRATHVRTGLGGHEGRRLQAGDRLPLGDASAGANLALRQPWRRSGGPIRIVSGPQDDYFSVETRRAFLKASFVVSPARDRMAQMLDGHVVHAEGAHDIVSDGTCAGSIQVPASGRPIVLMAERQTTGGYPKIATVATVDLPRLAQIPSGRTVCFASISQENAEELLIAERSALRQRLATLVEKPETYDVSGGLPS